MRTELEQIDADIKRNETFVKLAGHLERLKKNDDYKEIFEETYFKEHAIRQVELRGDDSLDEEQRGKVLEEIDAIGKLSAFLRAVKAMGNHAQYNIEQLEEERLRIEEEGK